MDPATEVGQDLLRQRLGVGLVTLRLHEEGDHLRGELERPSRPTLVRLQAGEALPREVPLRLVEGGL